jgi:hypothetical protein
MKRFLLLPVFSLLLVGCVRHVPEPAAPESDDVLRSDFSAEFDRLFLSQEPLRYQDNEAFLEAIRPEDLSSDEQALVRVKLIQFLSLEAWEREYAPDSLHTGVASEMAFLRLGAVQLLAKVGRSEDVVFIQRLIVEPGGEHPTFVDACLKAIEALDEH